MSLSLSLFYFSLSVSLSISLSLIPLNLSLFLYSSHSVSIPALTYSHSLFLSRLVSLAHPPYFFLFSSYSLFISTVSLTLSSSLSFSTCNTPERSHNCFYKYNGFRKVILCVLVFLAQCVFIALCLVYLHFVYCATLHFHFTECTHTHTAFFCIYIKFVFGMLL